MRLAFVPHRLRSLCRSFVLTICAFVCVQKPRLLTLSVPERPVDVTVAPQGKQGSALRIAVLSIAGEHLLVVAECLGCAFFPPPSLFFVFAVSSGSC